MGNIWNATQNEILGTQVQKQNKAKHSQMILSFCQATRRRLLVLFSEYPPKNSFGLTHFLKCLRGKVSVSKGMTHYCALVTHQCDPGSIPRLDCIICRFSSLPRVVFLLAVQFSVDFSSLA